MKTKYGMAIYDLNENYLLNFPLFVVVTELESVIDKRTIEILYVVSNYELEICSSYFSLTDAINDFITQVIDLYIYYVEREQNQFYLHDKTAKFTRILSCLIAKDTHEN